MRDENIMVHEGISKSAKECSGCGCGINEFEKFYMFRLSHRKLKIEQFILCCKCKNELKIMLCE
ncbi:hypothetical protein [Clostridium sp.]|uniref:hypothetical protein n=1 Tax=Clostridium sp. TaxID=1506 RepID=UPI003F385284